MTVYDTVDETTTDIICIKCKKDDSDTPNEIVLCDRCGIGGLFLPLYPITLHLTIITILRVVSLITCCIIPRNVGLCSPFSSQMHTLCMETHVGMLHLASTPPVQL